MIPNFQQGMTTPRPNPSYPMAALKTSAYAPPLNYNQPNEVVGGYDTKVNPMTGQEIPQTNFTKGGRVAPEAGIASILASRGRDGDSMLIHMSPGEVRGLQALALAHGGSLSINPHTGLYEANFLKKLLPTLLGVGLSFMGIPAWAIGLGVGGVETARTGDLGKGLMAGLGAYGGAGLTSALSTAGATAGEAAKNVLQTGADATAQGIQAVAPGATTAASNVGALTGSQAINAAGAAGTDAITKALAPEAFKTAAAAPVSGANLSAGMSALRAAPGAAASAVGSKLGMAGIAGLGSTAADLMTPEYKAYNPEDPSYYISGGYDSERGFLPGYYTKKYPGFASGGGVARFGIGGAAFTRDGEEMMVDPRSLMPPSSGGTAVGYAPSQPPTPVAAPPASPPVDPLYGSAANLPYQGSGAEQLSSYMQNLNRSLIPAPKPPKPSTPAPTTAPTTPPSRGGLGSYADILNGLNLSDFGGMTGMNFDSSMFTNLPRGSSGGYSKPIYQMTADEVAAEDAARQAQQNTSYTPPATTTMPPDMGAYNPFAGTNIDFSGIGGSGSYMPPADSYRPPMMQEPEGRDFIPRVMQDEPVFDYAPPVYEPPAYQQPEPMYQPPAYQQPEPVYQPPAYREPEPVYQPPAYQQPVFDYTPEPSYTPPAYREPEPVYQPPAYREPEPIYQQPMQELAPVQEFVGTPYMPEVPMTPSFDFGRRQDTFHLAPQPVEEAPGMVPTPFNSAELGYRGPYAEDSYTPPAPVAAYEDYRAPEPQYSPFSYQQPEFAQEAQDYGLGGYNYDQFGNEYNFGFAKGGVAKRGRKRKQQRVAGKLVSGNGDGMSDSIKANIDGTQEARLTDGEFVIPADVVSHLGNGSTDAGSKRLYDMMARVRKARTGRSNQAPQVNVDRMMPR